MLAVIKARKARPAVAAAAHLAGAQLAAHSLGQPADAIAPPEHTPVMPEGCGCNPNKLEQRPQGERVSDAGLLRNKGRSGAGSCTAQNRAAGALVVGGGKTVAGAGGAPAPPQREQCRGDRCGHQGAHGKPSH